ERLVLRRLSFSQRLRRCQESLMRAAAARPLVDLAVHFAGIAPFDQAAVVRRAEHVDADPAQPAKVEQLLPRPQVADRCVPRFHPLECLARRLGRTRAEIALKAEQPGEMSRLRVVAGELRGRYEPVQPALLALAQLRRGPVLRVLGPGQPYLADFEFVPDRLRLQETGEVIPVLMRRDEDVEHTLGLVTHVL